MIQVLKFIKGFDITAPNTFFNMSTTGLRGHEFKLYKSALSTNIGKNFLLIGLLMMGIVCHSTLFQAILLTLLRYVWIDIIALSGV